MQTDWLFTKTKEASGTASKITSQCRRLSQSGYETSVIMTHDLFTLKAKGKLIEGQAAVISSTNGRAVLSLRNKQHTGSVSYTAISSCTFKEINKEAIHFQRKLQEELNEGHK